MALNSPAMPDVVDVLKDLVALDSVNPSLPGATVGERDVAAYLTDFWAKRHIDCQLQEVYPDRSNVIATVPGAGSEETLLFEAHMDTVTPNGMTIEPFAATEKDGKLYGRGACDTKGSLAAMMVALARLAAEDPRPRPTVTLIGSVDEEYSFKGIAHFVSDASPLTAAGAVVGEPTELRVVRAHKGCVRYRVIVYGRAAHSSVIHQGINAISKMATVIQRIEAELIPSLKARTHPLTGPATLNIGLIEGGKQVNFVPDVCSIMIDRRTVPGETPQDAEAEMQLLLERLRTEDPELRVEMEEPYLRDYSLNTAEDALIVRVAEMVCQDLGLPGESIGVPFCTDASKLALAGVPSIVFGPGSIDRAHVAEEWVELDQVRAAVEVYYAIMARFGKS